MSGRIKYIRTDTLPKTPIGADIEGAVKLNFQGEWISGKRCIGAGLANSDIYSTIEIPVYLESDFSITFTTVLASGVNGFAWLDSSRVAIGSEALSRTAGKYTVSATIPSTARYLWISCLDENISEFKISFDSDTVMGDVALKIPEFDKLKYSAYDNVNLTPGMRVAGGRREPNAYSSAIHASDYLEVPANSTICIYGVGNRTYIQSNGWGLYDENYKSIKWGTYDGDPQYIQTPPGTRYMAFTAYLGATPKVYFLHTDAINAASAQAFSGKYIGAEVLASTAICVGDSVTYGYRVDRDKTYPYMLARLTGWTIENAGVNGATAGYWTENYFSNYNFANYQVCLIEFGFNEGSDGGFTDTLDTDVEPYDDYHDFADTHTGNYCRLIEMIKEQNPNILIVMVHTHAIIQTPGVLEKIAARYGIPFIDILRGVDRFAGKKGIFQGDWTHLTVGGNYVKAVTIYNALCPILVDNIDKLFS